MDIMAIWNHKNNPLLYKQCKINLSNQMNRFSSSVHLCVNAGFQACSHKTRVVGRGCICCRTVRITFTLLMLMKCCRPPSCFSYCFNKWRSAKSGAKTIKKNTNSTQNKSKTHRAKQYNVTSFLSTDCELSTETCSKKVYSLGPWPFSLTSLGKYIQWTQTPPTVTLTKLRC